MGSTREARKAGRYPEKAPTAAKTNDAAAMVAGSRGLSPNNSRSRDHEPAATTSSPVATPSAIRTPNWMQVIDSKYYLWPLAISRNHFKTFQIISFCASAKRVLRGQETLISQVHREAQEFTAAATRARQLLQELEDAVASAKERGNAINATLEQSAGTFANPSGPAATPDGSCSWAFVAGPPSPAKPGLPFPATVVIIPAGSILRMAWLFVSAMYTFPSASTATS